MDSTSLLTEATSLSTAFRELAKEATSERSDSSESIGTDPLFTASTSMVIDLMRSRTVERSLWREATVASTEVTVSLSEDRSPWMSPTVCWVEERSERSESAEL